MAIEIKTKGELYDVCIIGSGAGGAVKSSASSRADGIAKRGKTKGRMI